MKKWKVGVTLVCTSVLLGFAANQKVEAAIHTYGSISNVNQQEGTYDVTIHATTDEMGINGIREVSVPIWTNKDDLVWYKAKHQGKGVWKVRMNVRNHKNHRGNYTTHIYIYSKDGQVEGLNAGQTKLNNVLSAEIKNVNAKAGTYDVVVKDQIGGAVDRVSVPIWSTIDKMIVWYPATKQSDGTWIAHFDYKKHKYMTGKYKTHVYMYTKNQGVHAINLGETEITGQPLSLSAEIKNVNSQAGSYDVVVKASAPSGVKSVRVPIWTNARDIKWYEAKRQADGTWLVHMDIKNHGNHVGKYTTHVYMTANDGRETAINVGQTELKGQPLLLSAEIKNVNSQAGSYDVVVKANAPSGVKSVRVPIWTNARDIKWYEAKRQADSTWLVHMDIKNHGNHVGKYTTHVYMTANDGRETAINAGQTEIKGQPLSLSAEIKNVNSQAGSYDVVVRASAPSGVKSVRVPIWTNPRDLKWYAATKQSDGTWLVHMNIKNHSNHLGKYTTHVYMTANDGRETAINLGQTELKGQTKPTEQPGKTDTSQQGQGGNTNTGNTTEQPQYKQASFTLKDLEVAWARTDRVIDESYLRQAFVNGTDEYGKPLSVDKLKITTPIANRTIKGGTDIPVRIEVTYQAKNGVVKRYMSVSVAAPVNTVEGVRKEMLKLVNELRASVGVQPVQYDESLNKASDVRVNELMTKFSHVRPNGEGSSTALKQFVSEDEYYENYIGMGENIQSNSMFGDDYTVARRLFESWKNSPGHYQNMIMSEWNVFGFSMSDGFAQQFFSEKVSY